MTIRNAALALTLAMGIGAAALPAPVLAQPKELGRAGEWSVSRFPKSCIVIRAQSDELVTISQLRDGVTGALAISTTALTPYIGAGKDRIALSIDGQSIAMHNADVKAGPVGMKPRLLTAFPSSALWPSLIGRPFRAEFKIDGQSVWKDTVTVPAAMGTLFLDCVTGAAS